MDNISFQVVRGYVATSRVGSELSLSPGKSAGAWRR
jgi:hypothetical protein